MPSRIEDPEDQMLAAVAGALEADCMHAGADDPWAGSPFAGIRTRPSRQVGKIGAPLVAGWCAARGLDVTRSSDSQAERVIAGRRVEIRFSTRRESGVYECRPLRGQDYEFAACLEISPLDAHCRALSEDRLLQHVIGHVQAAGTAVTALLRTSAGSARSAVRRMAAPRRASAHAPAQAARRRARESAGAAPGRGVARADGPSRRASPRRGDSTAGTGREPAR
ncbi:MAG: hypothetical protein U1F07_14455 [Rubrivivax sp.]